MFVITNILRRVAWLASLFLLLSLAGCQADELKTLATIDEVGTVAANLAEAQQKHYLETGRYAKNQAELAPLGLKPTPAGFKLIIETWPNETGLDQEFRALIYDPDKESLTMYDSALGGYIEPPADPAEIALHLRRYLKNIDEAQDWYFKQNSCYTDDLDRLLPLIYERQRPPLYLRAFTSLELIGATATPASPAGFVASLRSPDGRLMAVLDSLNREASAPAPARPLKSPGYLASSLDQIEPGPNAALTGLTLLTAGQVVSQEIEPEEIIKLKSDILKQPDVAKDEEPHAKQKPPFLFCYEKPFKAAAPINEVPAISLEADRSPRPSQPLIGNPAQDRALRPLLAFLREAQELFFLQQGSYAANLDTLAALKPDPKIKLGLELAQGPGGRPGFRLTAEAAPEKWHEIYDSLRGGPLKPSLHSQSDRRLRHQARLALGLLNEMNLPDQMPGSTLRENQRLNFTVAPLVAQPGLTVQEAPEQRPGFLILRPEANGHLHRCALSLELIPGPAKGPGFVLAATDLESGQTEIFNSLKEVATPKSEKTMVSATKELVDYLANQLEYYFVEYGYYPESLTEVEEALRLSERPIKSVELKTSARPKQNDEIVIDEADGRRTIFKLTWEQPTPLTRQSGRTATLTSPDQRWAEVFDSAKGEFATLDLSSSTRQRALAAEYLRLLAAAQEYHFALQNSYATDLEGLPEKILRQALADFKLKVDLATDSDQKPGFVISVLNDTGKVTADCDQRTIRIYGPSGPDATAARRGQQLVRAQKFFRYLAKAQEDYLTQHGTYAVDLNEFSDPHLLTAKDGFEVNLELKTNLNNEPGFQATVKTAEGEIIDIYHSDLSRIYDRWL